MRGWHSAITKILDPFDEKVQNSALEETVKHSLQAYGFIPAEDEPEPIYTSQYWNCASDSDSDINDELDLMKKRVEGTRKSNRIKTQAKPVHGHANIATDQIELSEDSEFE